jgi:hypothetical protein
MTEWVHNDRTTMDDEGDPSAHLFGILTQAGGQQDGRPFPAQPLKGLVDLADCNRAKPTSGLIEEQERRLVQKGASDHQPLLHAAREGANQVLRALAQETRSRT